MQQSSFEEKKANDNVLMKHLSAVHNRSSLTVTQRKSYNILLKHSFKNIKEDREHRIPIKELQTALGWSDNSNTNDELKERLKELSRIQVEWNILGQDNKNKWTVSSLLAAVTIEDGDIIYSYSLPLQEILANPNIYARLDMGVQKELTNKYAFIFWELICGDLSVKNRDYAVSDWISYNKILDLLDLKGTSYEKRYALFRNQVLAIAISDINEKSDVHVQIEEQIKKRAITALRFIARRKNTCVMTSILPEKTDNPVFSKMKELGFSDHTIEDDFLNKYSEQDLEIAINFYIHYLNTVKEPVKNPVALFQKALDKGWFAPATIKAKLKEEKKENIEEQIKNLIGESAENINLRLQLLSHMEEKEYLSWFKSIKFEQSNGYVYVCCPSEFVCSYLESNFAPQLRRVVQQCIPNTVDIKITCMAEEAKVYA